eukprot:UN26152
MIFWLLHSLDLLGEIVNKKKKSSVVQFLKKCEHENGGYAGGPSQMAHLAPTYAAISALVTVGTEQALKSINTKSLYNFLMTCKNKDGSFSVHKGGERDVRGSYCALAVASMCNILTPELTKGTADFISRCQTYEGGIAAEPGDEAHGGYALCGLAALVIMNEENKIDLPNFIHWATARQMNLEGGFQG